VPGYLADDVQSVPEPLEFAARRRWEDRDLAVFALIAVSRYVLAMVSETRFSVVW
jgi:hypothetical protein